MSLFASACLGLFFCRVSLLFLLWPPLWGRVCQATSVSSTVLGHSHGGPSFSSTAALGSHQLYPQNDRITVILRQDIQHPSLPDLLGLSGIFLPLALSYS